MITMSERLKRVHVSALCVFALNACVCVCVLICKVSYKRLNIQKFTMCDCARKYKYLHSYLHARISNVDVYEAMFNLTHSHNGRAPCKYRTHYAGKRFNLLTIASWQDFLIYLNLIYVNGLLLKDWTY